MGQKIYEYVFTQADHDYLQESLLTRDILGSSSWKGEKKVIIYSNRIETWDGGSLSKTHLFSQFDGFYVDTLIGSLPGTYRTLVLVKKVALLSFYEKWIVPTLFKNKGIISQASTASNQLTGQGESLKILASRVDEFAINLEKVPPKLSDDYLSARLTKNDSRSSVVWIAFLILISAIIFIRFHFF